MSNVCIRCGKERIVTDTWDEKLNNGLRTVLVTHIKTVCPDPACQKEVDKSLAVQAEKDLVRKQERANKDRIDEEERAKRAEVNFLKAKKRNK